ncbi:monovalent cation:proton antiporter-2 (CPA2) family protein [Parvularcula dongshanensis]|uniref:Monovalent cation:proton antiporter-2 (CPA2) family protein n=1 Tax=Parvularcula dongshanensis TaxID=1173995 RepID=A0A840I7A1_9PROT|nr:monovalent cation:proton antiporter-2 (CPA2) family protein [Parvularcula dongshanensis]MBB4660054.1 monovalent cation:proton antiporter-2 (CPA2) family protein [Parvularcula dongshanensis]
MAGPANTDFLVQAATYLGATAVAVPLFKRLKLGTVIGFLAAGLVLGPDGLGLLRHEEDVFGVAEFGVVLFLFVIGLELSLPRLWEMRRTIFGLGVLQMGVTGALVAAALTLVFGLDLAPGLIAGFAFACSSTAFVLSLLEERRELATPYGRRAFSVLLFQDLAVIPLLAAIPIFAGAQGGEVAFSPSAILLAAVTVVGVILIGRFVLDPFFRLIASAGSREAFAAAALFAVAGVALLVSAAGLSMALGAFLAGVLLAESSYRHRIEADIEPFRELLLGLFFIGVGMQLDLEILAREWLVILVATIGLVALKGGVLWLVCRLTALEPFDRLRVAAILSQGGEFAFVVFSLGAGRGLFSSEFATLAAAVVTLSMVATPLLLLVIARTHREAPVDTDGFPSLPEESRRVVLVGFGRFGQIIAQVLIGSRVSLTAVDTDPRRIEAARAYGHEVYYGDGTDLSLLRQAGALRADAIIFAVKDTKRVSRAVEALKEEAPDLRIVLRAYDRMAALELLRTGADAVIRDTLESALKTARITLDLTGHTERLIDDVIDEFRERDRARLFAQKDGDIFAKKDEMLAPFAAVGEERRNR